MTERIGESEFFGCVRLPGWRLTFDKRGADGSAKANLRPAPESAYEAWAAAYSVDERQLALLDHFEGCGGGYETFRFDVKIKGETREALAYLTPSHWTTSTMLPYDWYRDLVVAGCHYHALPHEYSRFIEAVSTMKDPDRYRAELHSRLLASISAPHDT